LRVAGVSHRYGAVEALRDVSLEVGVGRFTALLGENGAGKTTLFNLITRLFDTRSGAIAVCGFDLRAQPTQALRRLGVVFQSRALDAALTASQNLAYRGALHGLSRAQARARGAEALARLGLADLADRPVSRLSGGQARRVEIACALLHGPRLLLCDEATVGLDVSARAALVADMHRLAAEQGVGVLWATHLIDEIAPDDDVAVLHRGALLAQGRADAIAAGRPLQEAFLALTDGALAA
jgi:ABC-2 type transport system ATP-binding protein